MHPCVNTDMLYNYIDREKTCFIYFSIKIILFKNKLNKFPLRNRFNELTHLYIPRKQNRRIG